MSKTTIVGILTLLGTILALAATIVSKGFGAVDWPVAITAITGGLTALGFKLAADQKP